MFANASVRIAIISDTHDNLTTLKKAVDWMNKNGIEEIIHCGDICSAYTLKELSQNFPGKIHVVFGNVDGDIFPITKNADTGVTPNVVIYNEFGEIEIDSNPPSSASQRTTEGRRKIAFIHRPNLAKALAQTGKYDLVFYGHTHKPWEEKIGPPATPRKLGLRGGRGNCRLVNPGTLSGMFQKATFAIYDTQTDRMELKILEKL